MKKVELGAQTERRVLARPVSVVLRLGLTGPFCFFAGCLLTDRPLPPAATAGWKRSTSRFLLVSYSFVFTLWCRTESEL